MIWPSFEGLLGQKHLWNTDLEHWSEILWIFNFWNFRFLHVKVKNFLIFWAQILKIHNSKTIPLSMVKPSLVRRLKIPTLRFWFLKSPLTGYFWRKSKKTEIKHWSGTLIRLNLIFLDDFFKNFKFFSQFFGSLFLKNESDEGYSKSVHPVEKKSGYPIVSFVLNFNDRFFQKKNIKVTTDLEHWSEIFLIFFQNHM